MATEPTIDVTIQPGVWTNISAGTFVGLASVDFAGRGIVIRRSDVQPDPSVATGHPVMGQWPPFEWDGLAGAQSIWARPVANEPTVVIVTRG